MIPVVILLVWFVLTVDFQHLAVVEVIFLGSVHTSIVANSSAIGTVNHEREKLESCSRGEKEQKHSKQKEEVDKQEQARSAVSLASVAHTPSTEAPNMNFERKKGGKHHMQAVPHGE